MNTVDRDLSARAAQGDLSAFSQLVHEYSDLVYRVASRILGADDAQDASQEVWIRVWRNIKDFEGQSAFSTWLYRITVNTCLNARRKDSRREQRETRDDFLYLPEPPGGDNDPEAATLGRERMSEVLKALQGIRSEHRAALVLRHLEGLGYAEIAEIMDVPEGTAKGWVSRGRTALLLTLVPETGSHANGGGLS
ncbi:MAG: RNA polymerase sigma factor [Rubrobacteraceae bacterium]